MPHNNPPSPKTKDTKQTKEELVLPPPPPPILVNLCCLNVNKTFLLALYIQKIPYILFMLL